MEPLMNEPTLPGGLIEGWHTPIFDFESVPDLLEESHLTTVWAELCVQSGSVRFVDLDGTSPRDVRVEAGATAVIVPGVGHQIEPSSDATFFVRFYREPGADLLPGAAVGEAESARGSGPWEHRGRDLDTPEEIFEMVTRQYADVVQDDLLQPYFNFVPGFIDWQAHIASVTDYWCHVLLFAPGYEIDVIEAHRHLHDKAAFTPQLFDRWLDVFHDTVDGGWTGPLATAAQKRSVGTAWAMAHRFLGAGVWVHPDHR
jgi:hemoglobin